MAKKGTKYQIVDLGTHFVKAAVLEAQGGAFSISSAAAVPLRGLATDADGYLTELSQGFGDLADFFDRKTPIFFLCNESLARVGVAYLNNLPSGGVDDALTAERTKFISSFGTTSYEQTVANSFKLREKAQGKAVQVVAANVYAKVDHIDVLFDLCSSRKLTFGGAYPRLFAYNELFKMCFGGDPAALSSVACMVDVGYSSTGVVAFKDGNIVFHKVLHLGAVDFQKEFIDIERTGSVQHDLNSLVTILSTTGFSDSDEALSSLGMPLSNPSKYVEAILGQVDQLFTKIQLSIDYFSTVAATDFNTSMSTVMAVRKGPELICFTGGLATCPRFSDLATQYFGKACALVDTNSVAPMEGTSAKTDLSPHFFALCAGGASLAASDTSNQYNLGGEHKKRGSGKPASTGGAGGGGGGGSSEEPFVPNWAMLIFVGVLLGLGYWWFALDKEIKALSADLASKQTALGKAYDIITRYKVARTRDFRARAQLEYMEELMKNRINWSKFYQELNTAVPEGVKLFKITIETTLPEAGEAAADGTAPVKPKTVAFKMCGESKQRPGVAEFVDRLQKTNHFIDLSPPDIVQAGEGTGTDRGPCIDPEAQMLKLEKHFAFEIKGRLAY